MKKYIVFFFTIILIFCTMTSCVRTSNTDAIQLWHYHSERDSYYQNLIVESAKEYCEKNDITLELHLYNEKTMSAKDYILKRNLALAFGNAIIIDDLRTMGDLIDQHADYTKLTNYNYLFSSYKDRFCIPLGIAYSVIAIENGAMMHYGIDNIKPVITYSEYLKIKQDMRDKGAMFEFNGREFTEIIDYYLEMNGLLFVNKKSVSLMDSNSFRDALKNTIINVCKDIVLYNEGNLKINEKIGARIAFSRIYDKNSEMDLCDVQKYTTGIINPYRYYELGDVKNVTFLIYPYEIGPSPCFYMHKKISNDKIYDLANYIVSESSYLKIIKGKLSEYTWFVPVFDTKNIRNTLRVNENWEANPINVSNDNLDITDKTLAKDEIRNIMNSAYEIIAKDEDASREIADYYFYYVGEDRKNIDLFIQNTIINVAQKTSGDELSLKKFDPNSEEIIKIIDDEINEYITNFYLHNS